MKETDLLTRLSRFFVTLYFLNLGIVIMFLYKGGLSPVFLGVNFIAVAGLVITRAFSLKLYLPVTAFIFSALYVLAFLVHFNPARISSLGYAFYYLGSFLIVMGNVRTLFTKAHFGKVIRLVVYLHFATMVLQQLCYLLHLPIININPEFTDEYFENLSLFRLNALSNEPSYGATLMVIVGFVYYCLFPDFKKELVRFWLPVLYLFIFFQSALATILLPLVVLVMILGRRWWVLPFAVVILYMVVINLNVDNRVVAVIQNLEWKNFAATFIETDLSGAFRVVPSVFFIQQANPLTPEFWLGYGIDYGGEYVSRLMPGIEVFNSFAGGAIPFMIYDYGVLCFLSLMLFIQAVAAFGNKLAFWLIAVFILVNANFSTQLLWFFLAFCTAAKLLNTNEKLVPAVLPQEELALN